MTRMSTDGFSLSGFIRAHPYHPWFTSVRWKGRVADPPYFFRAARAHSPRRFSSRGAEALERGFEFGELERFAQKFVGALRERGGFLLGADVGRHDRDPKILRVPADGAGADARERGEAVDLGHV